MVLFLRADHAVLVAANPSLVDDLADKLSAHASFSIFLDNALAGEEVQSVRSFATMGFSV